MKRILAIEPDADRGVRLRKLVRENLNTDLVLTRSAHAAITAMREDRPDVILSSILLAASDEQALVAHLRATPSLRHLPVLTIPPVIAPQADTRSSSMISRLLRRPPPRTWLLYDANAVITRIEEAIEQSRIAAARADEEDVVDIELDTTVATPTVEVQISLAPAESVLLSSESRRRSPRRTRADLPWLSSVKLAWGQSLRLLNISRSGILVESGVRFSPGSATSFKIGGDGMDLVVPARVVRCRVAEVDSLGVKYETAATFDRPVESLSVAEEAPIAAGTQLADLAATVEKRAASGAPAAELRAEFETGVLALITARDVRLRDLPVVENDGRESVYFRIPTRDGAPAVLQITFNPNDEPSSNDFAVMTAAADAAAALLTVTGTARQTSISRIA